MPAIHLSAKQACDLEMMAIGAFSPLTGFVGQADFESICRDMRLANGTIWPIPITLAVDEEAKASLKAGAPAALYHPDGTLLGSIDVDRDLPARQEAGDSQRLPHRGRSPSRVWQRSSKKATGWSVGRST